jgi:hypothetical protein
MDSGVNGGQQAERVAGGMRSFADQDGADRDQMIQTVYVDTAPGDRRLDLFDCVLDGKHLYVAAGLVRDVDGEMQLPDLARDTMLALVQHAERAGCGNIRFYDVDGALGAGARVRDALEGANEKDVVFFCCFGVEAHDMAIAELNPVWLERQRAPQ